MLTVPVSPGGHSYEVLIGSGLLAQTGHLARRYFPFSRFCVIVTDSTVGPLYAESVAGPLRDAGFSPEIITVPAGEASKSFAELQNILRGMLQAGLDRHSFLIALGGGVVGDLAGFAAHRRQTGGIPGHRSAASDRTGRDFRPVCRRDA